MGRGIGGEGDDTRGAVQRALTQCCADQIALHRCPRLHTTCPPGGRSRQGGSRGGTPAQALQTAPARRCTTTRRRRCFTTCPSPAPPHPHQHHRLWVLLLHAPKVRVQRRPAAAAGKRGAPAGCWRGAAVADGILAVALIAAALDPKRCLQAQNLRWAVGRWNLERASSSRPAKAWHAVHAAACACSAAATPRPPLQLACCVSMCGSNARAVGLSTLVFSTCCQYSATSCSSYGK